MAAVSDVSFRIDDGESVGVVGESGSGKTQTFLSIMGLLASNGACSGSARFHGQELLGLPARQLNRIRGVRLAMVFQDPMTSLNPYLRISRQMTEVLIEHKGMNEASARAESLRLLDRVGIPAAPSRFDLYPHEFSGGMRQRVMIATALLCQPDLLIADEPTTALDVTVQAEVLELIRELCTARGTAVLMISHDLGLIATMCRKVAVMYAGRVVEQRGAGEIFRRPSHPYTAGLVGSLPLLGSRAAHGRRRLAEIPGVVPGVADFPQGCRFNPRCGRATEICRSVDPPPEPLPPEGVVRCHHHA